MKRYHVMLFLSEIEEYDVKGVKDLCYGPKRHVASVNGFTNVQSATQWFWDLLAESGEDCLFFACDIRPYWPGKYEFATPKHWCHFGDSVIAVCSRKDRDSIKAMCEREMELQPRAWKHRHYFEEGTYVKS